MKMVLLLDDKKMAEYEPRYKRMIKDTPYGNPHTGPAYGAGLQNQSLERRIARESIEKCFTVFGAVKEHAGKYGSPEFSQYYGLFCGSIFGDSFIEQQVREPCDYPITVNISADKSEQLLIPELIGVYFGIISKSEETEMPKLTRKFFQGISSGAEKALITLYGTNLEEISKDEIIIGSLRFKGIEYNGRKTITPQKQQISVAERKEDMPEIEPVKLSKKLSFEDIGGNYSAIEASKHVLQEIKHPEILDFYGIQKSKGILLYGPPGTGKQCLPKLLQARLKSHFMKFLLKRC